MEQGDEPRPLRPQRTGIGRTTARSRRRRLGSIPKPLPQNEGDPWRIALAIRWCQSCTSCRRSGTRSGATRPIGPARARGHEQRRTRPVTIPQLSQKSRLRARSDTQFSRRHSETEVARKTYAQSTRPPVYEYRRYLRISEAQPASRWRGWSTSLRSGYCGN